MPPVTRTHDEETNFLDDLFSELDSSAAVAKPASPTRQRVTAPPPRTPVHATRTKASPRTTPRENGLHVAATLIEHALHAAEHEDLDALMAGVEDWDWDDMNSDFMTPRKSSPVKPKVRLILL